MKRKKSRYNTKENQQKKKKDGKKEGGREERERGKGEGRLEEGKTEKKEKRKRTKELQNKIVNKMAIVKSLPISNYFIYKCIKFFNQKTEWFRIQQCAAHKRLALTLRIQKQKLNPIFAFCLFFFI